jgi:hypothetical protein
LFRSERQKWWTVEESMPTVTTDQQKRTFELNGAVYCPLCTHTVEAKITYGPKAARVTPGQRCPRCSSSLDAGYVIRVNRAA